MGYILPLPHYEYKQYQEREMKVRPHSYGFVPVHSITKLTSENREHEKLSQNQRGFQSTAHSDAHRMVADITGKGKYVNEYA